MPASQKPAYSHPGNASGIRMALSIQSYHVAGQWRDTDTHRGCKLLKFARTNLQTMLKVPALYSTELSNEEGPSAKARENHWPKKKPAA